MISISKIIYRLLIINSIPIKILFTHIAPNINAMHYVRQLLYDL